MFDDLGPPVSGILDAEVCTAYRPIVDAGAERGWTRVAHDLTNSRFVSGMDLDQFEQLLADSTTAARVMTLPLHTFVVGAPHRTKHLARVPRETTSTPGVWVCTSDDLAVAP